MTESGEGVGVNLFGGSWARSWNHLEMDMYIRALMFCIYNSRLA